MPLKRTITSYQTCRETMCSAYLYKLFCTSTYTWK